MSDLEMATADFLARVDRNTPDEAKRVRTVLEDLLQWSAEHSWGVSFCGQRAKGLVWYCEGGVAAPFWSLTPRSADGAKFTLLPAHKRYPEDLREEARRVLAQVDGRIPKADEIPTVGCMKLLWPPHRDTVFDMMTRALNVLHGRPVTPLRSVATPPTEEADGRIATSLVETS